MTQPTGPARKPQRSRDPQARRQALTIAALETIAEVGIGRTTHRAVAAKAGLPLGATTYYFPTLDDLIAAALRHATAGVRADLQAWGSHLTPDADLPVVLTGLIREYLSDRQRVRVEYELYVAAGRDETLRPLAEEWLDGFRELLRPQVGVAANEVVALVDGVMLQALITGRDVDEVALTTAVRRLISGPA